jgi:hypothetical protein
VKGLHAHNNPFQEDFMDPNQVNKVVAAILTQAYFTAKQNEDWDEAQIMKQVKEVFESLRDMISDS